MGKILGAITGANAAKKAAKAQERGQQRSIAEGRRQFDLTRSDFTPFRESGVRSLSQLTNALGVNGQQPQQDFFSNFQNDPGFQAEVDFGLGGVEKSLAARGMLNSGRSLRDLQTFGQLKRRGAFNDRLNMLARLSGAGQSATTQGANIGSNITQGIQRGLIGSGNARASGFTNAANANIGFANNLLRLGAQAFGGGAF